MTTSWRTLDFDSAVVEVSGGNVKTPQRDYKESGRFAVVDQGKALVAGYVDEVARVCKAPLPVVVFGDHTRCLKFIDFPFGIGADGVKVLRPRTAEIDEKYLYHFLRQLHLPDGGYDRHFKYLKRERIPFPGLPEQRRIAAILDQAETLRAQRRAAIAELDSLGQAIFLEMFGDPVKNPMGWPRKPLRELGIVVTGNTPSRAKDAYYGDEVEWIKSDNINTPDYYLTRAAEGLSGLGRAVGRIAPPGSILVTCIAGSPDCIGNAGMADREVAFNQQINAFIPKRINAHFTYQQLIVGKKLVQAASTNGMKGMVSKSRFEQVEVMQPPVELQGIYERRVLAVQQLRRLHIDARDQAEALFASLQHRAFRGEL